MMADADLFEAETAALATACAALTGDGMSATGYRTALESLAQSYQRLLRETRRLIAHSDRKELELNALNARLQQLSAELDYKAKHDNLTGVLNRGAVFERAEYCLAQGPLALIVLDIDFFKRINDEFGHPIGDSVIRELVMRLKTSLAGRGEIGRVGGEEFTVLLPETGLAQAADMAEAARLAIAGEIFACFPRPHVTASFGVSWTPCGCSFEEAYGNADAALYAAKRNGRNRVELAGVAIQA